MPDGVQLDASDFSKLSADLDSLPAKSGPRLVAAMHVTSGRVRDAARENATGIAHAPAFPYSISYDIHAGYSQSAAQAAMSLINGAITSADATTLVSEIGPSKSRRQGSLGNLLEYGSVKNPPQGILHGALQRNEADFEHGIDRAINDALREAGL